MRFNSIKYIALLALAAATVAGCTKAPVPDLGEELDVLLQMSVGTKAVTETDGTPTAAESAIHTLRVYAFVDGKAAGHFYTPDYAALEDAAGTASGTAKHFLMDIKMYSLGTKDVDFYVVANEGAMTAGSAARLDENTTEAELKGFTFTSLNLGNGMALGLPMCCKKRETIDFASDDESNPQTVPGHEGHTLLAQKLSFELERPVGKIGVFAAKPIGEEGTLTVTGLSVTRSRFVNFLMLPADLESAYSNPGSASERELEVVDGSVTVTTEVASGETDAAEYTPVQAEAYYPFENPWGSTAWNLPGDSRGNILTIRYKYDTDSQERTGTVYLPPIDRNTYYMVCCQLSNSGKITVNYSVADWDDAEPYKLEFAAPEYELPTQSYPVASTPYARPTVHYNGDPAAQEGTFSINFKISGPVGQVWTPTLLNATDADYQITVTQNGSPVAAPYLASADPYGITIRALRPDNVGKTLEFAISYTPQWDPTGTSLLMINGNSESELRWPVPAGTVNPTYKIVIEQVEP